MVVGIDVEDAAALIGFRLGAGGDGDALLRFADLCRIVRKKA